MSGSVSVATKRREPRQRIKNQIRMEGEHPGSTPLYRRQTVRTSVESGDFEVFIRQPLDFTGWDDDLDGEKAEIPGKLKGEIFELSVRHPSGLTDGGEGKGNAD